MNLKQEKTEQVKCPGSKEIGDLTSLIANRYIKLIKRNDKKKNFLVRNLHQNISPSLHHYQRYIKLKLIETASSILERNGRTTKVWWQRTEPFLKKIFVVLENAKEEETAFHEILIESLHQFIQLKNSWGKQTHFLSKLVDESKLAVIGSYSLLELARNYSNSHWNMETHTDLKSVIADLFSIIEKVKQASIFVESIASVYVTVVNRFIADLLYVEHRNNSGKTESQRQIPVFSKLSLHQQKLAIRKCYLQQSSQPQSTCRNPEKGLRAFENILKTREDDDFLIKQKLQQTRNDILNEYQWIAKNCPSSVFELVYAGADDQ
jgi:hypothetical protein